MSEHPGIELPTNADSSLATAPRAGVPGIRPVILLLMVVIFLVDLYLPQGVVANLPFILILFMTYWGRSPSFTMLITALTLIFSMLGFFYSPPSETLWKAVFNRVLSILVMIATAALLIRIMKSEEERHKALAERKTALEEREKALDEVRVLRGILPTCASCKKIRDQSGTWTQIESYIRKHSEAEFSHSICPDCMKKLYPEFTSTPPNES